MFRDFSIIFMIFNEFIWIYFELKRNKIIKTSHAEVEADAAHRKMCHRVAAYVYAMWRARMHECVSAHVRVCERVCVCLCMSD